MTTTISQLYNPQNRLYNKLVGLKSFLFVIIAVTLYSCSTNEPAKETERKDIDSTSSFLDKVGFGSAFYSDTKLFLNAQFSECGEWGGHAQKIIIYVKGRHEFYLNYKKFKVNCEVVDKNNGSPIQQLDRDTTISINNQSKISVDKYLHRILKSKTEEGFPGHAGNLFSAVRSDSTLVISVYDNKEFDVDSYLKLLSDLKLN